MVAILIAGCAIHATAQTTVVVTMVLPAVGAPLSEARDLFIDLDSARGRARERSAIQGAIPWIGRPVSTFDGRFIAAAATTFSSVGPIVHPVTYRDLLTGATGAIGNDVRSIVAHPTRQAVFLGFENGDVGLLDVSGLTRRPLCDPSPVSPPNIAASLDGVELYVTCFTSLRVIDSAMMAEIRRFNLRAEPRSIYAVASGRLFTLDNVGPGGPIGAMEMSVYDVVSGARVANAPTPMPWHGLPWAVPTPDATRVIVGAGYVDTTPLVVDSATAAVVDVWPIDGVIDAALTSTGDRAILLREHVQSGIGFLSGVLLDIASKTVLAEGPLGPSAYGRESHLVVLEPPQPPGDLTAEISGSSVTLRWIQPGASRRATDHSIEAGSTPTDFSLLSQRTGSDEPVFVAPNVPRGVYYVRVRAVNAVGVSLPSATIQVIVP
jgi:hypothetical protein